MQGIEKNVESAKIIAKIAKYKEQSICALACLSEKNSIALNEILKEVEGYKLAVARPKKDDEISFEENFEIQLIKKIKTNIRENYTNSVVQYTPTDVNLVNQIEALCEGNQFEKVDSIHTTVLINEKKSFAVQLLESYYRGKIYYHCFELYGENFPEKFPSIKAVHRSLIYRYKSFYQLISTYPSLVFAGVGVTEMMKYKTAILKTMKMDDDFHKLVTQPFPGFNIEGTVMSTTPFHENDYDYDYENQNDEESENEEEVDDDDNSYEEDENDEQSEDENSDTTEKYDEENTSTESEGGDILENIESSEAKIAKPSSNAKAISYVQTETKEVKTIMESKRNSTYESMNAIDNDEKYLNESRKKVKFSDVFQQIESLRQDNVE